MRARLEALAFRMLGTRAEAEDVVQDAYLRLHSRATEPDNVDAWLFRVVANLAVDRLRRAKIERRAYEGPWLPEPVPDASSTPELAENLSFAFMAMLDRLTPAERVAFVLREGFDLSFADIGETLGVSEEAARQRLRRARKRLAAEPAVHTPVEEQSSLIDRLLLAIAEDDVAQLVSLLHPQAVAYTDGGGVVSAARIPVVEPARIAQVTMHLVKKALAEGGIEIERVRAGGGVLQVVRQNGRVHSVMQITAQDGLIRQVFVMRNPEKLAAFF